MDLGIVWRQAQCRIETLQGAVDTAKLAQRFAQAQTKRRVVWIEDDGMLIACDGFVCTPELAQHFCTAVMRSGGCGREVEQPIPVGQGIVEAPQPLPGSRQTQVSIDIFRIEADGPGITCQGLLRAAKRTFDCAAYTVSSGRILVQRIRLLTTVRASFSRPSLYKAAARPRQAAASCASSTNAWS